MNDALAALSLRVLDLETINRLNAVAEAGRAANEVGNAAAYSEAAMRDERIRQRTAACASYDRLQQIAKVNLFAAREVAEYAKCDETAAAILIAAIAAGRIPGVSIAY